MACARGSGLRLLPQPLLEGPQSRVALVSTHRRTHTHSHRAWGRCIHERLQQKVHLAMEGGADQAFRKQRRPGADPEPGGAHTSRPDSHHGAWWERDQARSGNTAGSAGSHCGWAGSRGPGRQVMGPGPTPALAVNGGSGAREGRGRRRRRPLPGNTGAPGGPFSKTRPARLLSSRGEGLESPCFLGFCLEEAWRGSQTRWLLCVQEQATRVKVFGLRDPRAGPR